ncbi:efflux RND transporter periplasmic adaptor subunit [Stieleria mannarensis]|uniref:efflux RND transporter periplasmic adaptor subunit n=1 Tax=Stieleria mannarensis TaxID=2755585 RepID=UPI001600C392|nr:efflux RND transporter periplasmic adaptor subunit [Rhodopirellula sp. JC639]
MKSSHRSADLRLLSFQSVLIAVVALACRSSLATEVQGYTEPVRTIEVASDETGTVAEVLVQLGQTIEQGQPLLRLNSQVHLAQIEVAKQQMNAQGRLDAAKAEVELTSARLEKIESLRKSGHARQAELHRAAKEYKVAEANLRSVVEEMETRRLEHDRLLTQMSRRVIHAPVTGIVTELHKEPGEFVAPNKPEVITLVQLDTLLANFALLGSQAEQLTTGQEIELQFPESGQTTSGKVHFISPVTDAESGTVLVKIAIGNADGSIRSGARCAIQLKD